MRSPHSPEPLEAGTAVAAPVGALPREFRLPAVPAQLVIARGHVERAALAMGFDERATYEIVFAVNEAVTNAVQHGSPDHAGTIGLFIEPGDDGLTVVVSDSGSFGPSPADCAPTSEQGRGLVLMSQLMDQVDLLPCAEGTVVRLHRDRNGASAIGGDRGA
jgi:anti-sigma regulatory factor (Ser/Thr protein kinase)